MVARSTIFVRSLMTMLPPLTIIACAAPATPNTAQQIPSTTSAPAASQAAGNDLVLYLQQEYGSQLQPIDPVTLADSADRSPFVLEGAVPYTPTLVFISANGGTVVALDSDRVRVLDGLSNTQRAEWPRPEYEYIHSISPDGTWLAAGQLRENEHAQGWAVLSVEDGHILASARSLYPVFDWQNNRVYGFAGSGDPLEQIEPQPAVLLVHDLQTGEQIGQLTLDDVLIVSEFRISMALHPNTQQLVILHGDADKLTLVDTQQLQIVSTRDVMVNQDEFASPEVGGADIQFAPNGTLYTLGNSVRRINVEQATIEAQAPAERGLGWWQIAPDGSALYLHGSRPAAYPAPATQGDSPPNLLLLRRLDPQTLAVTAERPFEGFYQPFLVMQPQQ